MGNFGSSVLLAGAFTASAGVQAQAIAITNPSFEANFAPAGGFPVLVPNGWNLYDPGGIVNQANNAVGVLNPTGTSFFTAPVPNGNNVALVYFDLTSRPGRRPLAGPPRQSWPSATRPSDTDSMTS